MKKYRVLLPLFIIQFFTWLGLFSLWIYTTPVIAKYFSENSGSAEESFNKAVEWAGYCFALYSLLGASLTFFLHKILKKKSKYLVHAVCLFLGSCGLISMYFFRNEYLIFVSFILIGIGWSSISTIPYLIVGEKSPEDQAENFYSVFNFSTVIPQAIASFLLAYITSRYLGGDPSKTIFCGGIFMMVASGISFIEIYRDK